MTVAVRTLMIGTATGLTLAVTGCGSDAGQVTTDPGSVGLDPSSLAENPEAAASQLVENLEGAQEAGGGGSATLTVGGEVYTFTKVLCAIGSDATGNDDFDFSLSGIQDGTQLSIDTGPTYGDNVSLDDVVNFDDPKVSWSSQGDGFLTIDGKNVSGQAEFSDGTSGDPTKTTPGTVEATCP